MCRSAFMGCDMHERAPKEKQLKRVAKRISDENGNAPVVIIVGGSQLAGVSQAMTATWIKEGREERLRDLLGLLQVSIQIETLKHFHLLDDPDENPSTPR
jgi:hypothetical protein